MNNWDFLLKPGNFAKYSSVCGIKKMKMTKNCQWYCRIVALLPVIPYNQRNNW